MSIYPVKISGKKGWFNKPPFNADAKTLRNMLPYLKCQICGKPITWKNGYVSHGIMYGFDDTNYCSIECYKSKMK